MNVSGAPSLYTGCFFCPHVNTRSAILSQTKYQSNFILLFFDECNFESLHSAPSVLYFNAHKIYLILQLCDLVDSASNVFNLEPQLELLNFSTNHYLSILMHSHRLEIRTSIQIPLLEPIQLFRWPASFQRLSEHPLGGIF